MAFWSVGTCCSECHDLKVEDVDIATLDCVAQGRRGRTVQVDSGHGGLRPLEDDVLGLLDVEVCLAKVRKDVRQHAWTIAVAHDEHVRRRRP